MSVLRLAPACKDYVWGGDRLVREYNKRIIGDRLAESWELSCHPAGESIIADGEAAGMGLGKYLKKRKPHVLGTNCMRYGHFPIMVKLIDACENLSVQVHPPDSYALSHEGQYGKAEAWYVVDARPGAFLYCGLAREVSEEEFLCHVQDHTLQELLNPVEVQKGDVLFIEPGTIHAIGKGILVAEIQQSSSLTYRLYDYGRPDNQGRLRPLQIDKALAVAARKPPERRKSSVPHLVECRYFTVDKLYLDGGRMNCLKGTVGEDSFLHLLVLEGEGSIVCEGKQLRFRKGDSILFTADSGAYEITGACEGLMTYIP